MLPSSPPPSALGVEGLAEVLPYLQPSALTALQRHRLRDGDLDLDALRERAAERGRRGAARAAEAAPGDARLAAAGGAARFSRSSPSRRRSPVSTSRACSTKCCTPRGGCSSPASWSPTSPACRSRCPRSAPHPHRFRSFPCMPCSSRWRTSRSRSPRTPHESRSACASSSGKPFRPAPRLPPASST